MLSNIGNRETGERVAKVIARSGLCSRRDAEALIADGRVSVNGAVISTAALDIGPGDEVRVDGAQVPARDVPRLWRYYKPRGRVTTHKDPQGRPTVFEALPENLPRLISIGRLDFNTEGLLLLTNDGDLARHLALPSTGWARRYRVRAHGTVEQSALDRLAGGLTVAGVAYGPVEAKLERQQGGNAWIALTVREGKNREVRRIIEHLGLEVNRLIRVSFGPFMLGALEPGQIEEVEARVLRDQLGARQSRQFGVRRSPIREPRRFETPLYLKRKRAETKPADARPGARAAPIKHRQFRQRRILPLDPATGEKPRLAPLELKTPAAHSRPGGGRAVREQHIGERPRRNGDARRAPRGEGAPHHVERGAMGVEKRRFSKVPSEDRSFRERQMGRRPAGQMKSREAPVRPASEMRGRERPVEGPRRFRKGKEARPPTQREHGREGSCNEGWRGAHSHGAKPRFPSNGRRTASRPRSRPRRPRPERETETP